MRQTGPMRVDCALFSVINGLDPGVHVELKIVTRGNSKLQKGKNDAQRNRGDKRQRRCNRSKFIAHYSDRPSHREAK